VIEGQGRVLALPPLVLPLALALPGCSLASAGPPLRQEHTADRSEHGAKQPETGDEEGHPERRRGEHARMMTSA
jgi:hypothetical protein